MDRTYTCIVTGESVTASRLPRGWKQFPAGPLSPAAAKGYVPRMVSLAVREVIEPVGTRLLDSLRDAWRLSTDLANWCQLEMIRRDTRRTPDMKSLPKYSVGSLYSIWNKEYPPSLRERFTGCAGSASAIIRECEQRWTHHPKFGRFAVIWKGESAAATYTYPYPWIVRAQEAKLTRADDGSPLLSVTVPGTRNLYRLSNKHAYQLSMLESVLAGEAKLGNVKLCAHWSGGRIVGVDAKMSVTIPFTKKETHEETATIATGPEALLTVRVPKKEDWLYFAQDLRGVLACYNRWRERVATDLKFEKRWPSHTRRRIVNGMQDRIQRHHCRLKTGVEQAVSCAVQYAIRQGCGKIVYDDRIRWAQEPFPHAQMRERLRLTAENLGLEVQIYEGAEDATT